MKKSNPEYNRFSALTDNLLRVPHSELKAKLDAEKKAKTRKKKRASRASSAKV